MNKELQETIEALADSKAHLKAILYTAVSAIITIDEYGIIESFNPAAEKCFGYKENEVVGKNVKMLMPDPYRSAHDDYLQHYRGSGEKNIIGVGRVVEGLRKDGTKFPVDISVGESEDSRKRFFVGIIQDVTERKLAEDRLIQEEQFSDSLLAAVSMIVLVLDMEGNIVTFNRYMESLTGYELGEVVGRNWFDTFLPERDRARLREIFKGSVDGNNVSDNVNSILTKAGGERFIRWSDQTLRDDHGNATGILATGLDITDRLKLERRVLEVGADEKQRIGRELHDSIGQELAGLKYLSRSLTRALEKSSSPEMETAKEITEITERILLDVAEVIRGLTPVDIDENGLMTALNLLATKTSERYDIVCNFIVDVSVSIKSSQLATQLYRIAQEAVTNAVKHANSNRIEIRLLEMNGIISLTIYDDGIGINQEEIAITGGMGLKIMQHRCESVSGHFNAGSVDGVGTKISCAVNLDRYREH